MDWKGGNWNGLFHRDKEPIPVVNVICAFFVNEKHFSCCKCLLKSENMIFLLLMPPSRKTRFKLI